ncbi:MAG: hypothetical protein ACFB10_06375 [Salibacteraceae bacterium]
MRYSKEEILKKIREIAELNNGKMIGIKKFESLTGIKEGFWKGRYWINWSDAVNEAGFKSANYKQPWDKNTMLKKLADLVLELDHFPQVAELKMKRFKDKSFPNAKSYRERIGNKLPMAKNLYD